MAKVKSKSFRKKSKRRISKKHAKKSKSRRRFRKFGGTNTLASDLFVAKNVENAYVTDKNVNLIGNSENPSSSSGSSYLPTTSSSSSPESTLSQTTIPTRGPVSIGEVLGNKSTTNFAPLPGTYEFLPKKNEREIKISKLPKDDQLMINKYNPLYEIAYESAMKSGEKPEEAATKSVISYMKVNNKTPEEIAYVLYLNKDSESVEKVKQRLSIMYPNEYSPETSPLM